MTKPRLWHFPFSHYSEKVRWALDYKKIAHTRTPFRPGFHVAPALARTGKRQLPILLDDDRAIADSSEIIAYLEEKFPEPPLFPSDAELRIRAAEWENELDEDYGTATRAIYIDALWDCPEFIVDQVAPFRPPFFSLGLALATPGLRLAGAIGRELTPSDLKKTRRRLDRLHEKIARRIEKHAFLVGDRFTVADLTAAALTAPIALFDEFPYEIRGKLPRAVRELHERYEDRPAVRWARGLYANYRGKSAETTRSSSDDERKR